MMKKNIKTTVVTNRSIGDQFEEISKEWLRKRYSSDILLLEHQYPITMQFEDILKVYTLNSEEFIKKYTNFNSNYVYDFRVVLKSGKQVFVESKSRDSKDRGKKDSKQGLNKDVAADTAIEKGRLLKLFTSINGIKDYEYIVISNAFPKITNNNYLKIFLAINIEKVINEVVILDNLSNENNLDCLFA